MIGRIKEAISHYGLSAEDLGLHARVPRSTNSGQRAAGRATSKKAKLGTKFADGSGQTWGGRGPRPAWLREALASGRMLDEFAVGKTTRPKAAAAVPPAPAPQDELKREHPGSRAASFPKTSKKAATAKTPANKTSPAVRRRATASESGVNVVDTSVEQTQGEVPDA